jgi:hypothetical protein
MTDLFLNTRFRRDIFAKAPDRLDANEQFLAKADQCFALNPAGPSGEFRLTTSAGVLNFDNLAAKELIRLLGERPASLSQLASRIATATLADLINTADALWAADIIRPVDAENTACQLDALNEALNPPGSRDRCVGLEATVYGTALPVAPGE